MAVNTTYDDKMFRFFDLRQKVSEMTQQYLDPVTGKIVTQEVPALERNAIINEINSEIRKYLDAHAKKVANWTPSAAQQAKGVQRRYDVTKIKGLRDMAELRRGMQKLITEIAYKHASSLGADPSGREVYGLPQLQDVFPDFKIPLTATDLASATVGLGSSFKTVGGTRYDVTDMPSRNIGEAERLLKTSGVQTIDKDTLAGRASYAVPDDAVVRTAGKPDELALDALQRVLSPAAVQSRYEAGVKSKTKELEDRQKATDKFTRKRINATKGGLTSARINQLIAQGMTREQARAEVRTPAEQEQLYSAALEAVLGGKNYASAGQVRNLSPELRTIQNAVRGAQASETKIGGAAPFLERQTVADLKVQALKENAKEAEFMRQYRAYKADGTPLSPAARRFFEGRSDLDGGEMYVAKHRRSLERGWLVHNANVATAKNILANKSKYGRKSAEVRWANNIMRREKNLRRGGGLIGRVFGGLPPWLIPVLVGIHLIGKLAGFINDTLNKIYKIVDGITAKAREQQQAQDALGISQSRVKWADSMKNAFGYNFAGAYTATARGLSDIESHEAGTEGAIKAMALMGSSAGIDTTIEQALTGKDTVKATHAALAAFVTGTANGDTYLGKQNSAQAYLTNYSQLEKGFGADTAVLAGQLYTQYKAMSEEQKAAANAYLQRGDLTGFVDAVANSTGGAGIVGMANASSELQSGLSEMSKMLKDQAQQYKDSFDEIRNQTALTWGDTVSTWQNFKNQFKLFAAHTFNGTYGSITEASSDAQKKAKNEENELAAANLIKEQEALIQWSENKGVLGTTLANDKGRSKFIKLSQGDEGDREKAWAYLYSMAYNNNLSAQEVNELISYMYAQNVKITAREAIKKINKQNKKDKGVGLVVDADVDTIKAKAAHNVEQAGMDAGNYTFWERFRDGAFYGYAGLAIGDMQAQNAYAVQRKVLGTEGEKDSDKQWHRDLSVGRRVSGAVHYLENVKVVLDKAAAAGYTATSQEVKVDVQAGKMYIQFDDPVSGRNRIVETPLTSVYSEHTNYGASTGNYNEAVNQMNTLNQAKVQ